ncbi:MAG: ImmA/IrrE family metallo-endopeptidase [Verrucomicrobiales bacterium]|nr:ImmA/IrrE family metallo-endopeptidase [Verrucomicrobiales bacterium]
MEEAENLANDLRAEWKLGTDPIPNMTELLEERGIKVLLANLPEKVSGLTCFVKRPRLGEETPVIVVNAAMTLERRRFTMAHELGHRVIDSSSEGDLEKLCHRFSGAFIVNREHLLNEIGERRSAFGVREIVGLKRLYRISAAAFLVRLEQIGVIDRSAIEYSFRTFASGWRSKEPEPLEGEKSKAVSEVPRRFERLVYRAAAEDMISMSKAVELLRVPLADVEKGLKGPSESHADRR